MNSRIESGTLAMDSREAIISSVKEWCAAEDVELDDNAKAYFFDGVKEAKPEGADDYISYWADDGMIEYERKIYFPENDTLEKFKERLICDEKVKEYVDPDAVIEFIYNCVDVNALSSVQHVALLYDEPILDEDGEIEDWKETAGRQELMDKASDGCDEYAMEVGLEQLGINWVERSAVIINVGQLVKTSEDIAEDIYGDKDIGFDSIFREGLVSTICHEFRHSVYDINETVHKDGSDSRYPVDGGLEENVEAYGNHEMEKLMINKQSKEYISKMFDVSPQKEAVKNKSDKPKTQELE